MVAVMARTNDTTRDDDRRWRAVLDSDRSLDGAFVTAVRTTRIYCRPSCPARKPKRENVEFFAAPDGAERAGYRACKRCRPREAAPDSQRALIQRVCDRIVDGSGAEPTLNELGAEFHVSPFHLQRTFKRITGVTPRQYAAAHRVGHLKQELRASGGVAGAVYRAGYGSSSRVYEQTGRVLGMTPAAYGRGGRGMRIAYTVQPCALGQVLVATTGRGIAFVCLGNSAAALESELRDEYPAAEIARDDRAAKRYAAPVVRAIKRRTPGPHAAGRCAGDGVPGARVAGAARDPVRRDALVHGDRARHRPAEGGARRRSRVRGQPDADRRAVPPRHPRGRHAVRVPVGRRTQARPAGAGAAIHEEHEGAATGESLGEVGWLGVRSDNRPLSQPRAQQAAPLPASGLLSDRRARVTLAHATPLHRVRVRRRGRSRRCCTGTRSSSSWLPPGGHIDPDEDPVQATVREVLEETGIAAEVVPHAPPLPYASPPQLPVPLSIIVADVGASAGEPAHQHIDMIYVLRPRDGVARVAPERDHGFIWVTRGAAAGATSTCRWRRAASTSPCRRTCGCWGCGRSRWCGTLTQVLGSRFQVL